MIIFNLKSFAQGIMPWAIFYAYLSKILANETALVFNNIREIIGNNGGEFHEKK